MFVDCHLTCGCENFQRRLFTLTATASPLQPIVITMPIAALALPRKLIEFMDMMATIVT
jgi:hypothetical protein